MNPKFVKSVFDRPMHILVILVITLLVTLGVTTLMASAQEATPWRDEFDGTLADGWYWVEENSDKWNLTDQPGFLRIFAAPYDEDGDRNLLLQQVAQGDFAIETRVLFTPDTNFQFAGLYIYQDDGTHLALGRAYCDIPDACVGNGIYFDYVAGGEWIGGNFGTPVDSPNEAFLRLERRGEMVKAFYSYEGITWFEIGAHWIPGDFQVNGVGLIATGDFDKSDEDIPADFDYFEITEGWGFLPEGFHDHDQGDVPSWACNAGGWAADPDDRAADLAIEINVDGTSLSDWLSASEYREDLDNAGVCVDGNCGFATSLWGTISSYEPHTIVAYAQDIPSGDWVQLSNSPKPLTCRTYDIYAFDPLTGETQQITNMSDADEYNPSWSPNGKLVAHSTVFPDHYGIYITDVKTGVSSPLAGAENGGDAAWSPNGKVIVFDRDGSLYITPAVNGVAKLVRSDAVSANWAPSGRRLVFQDLTDGSIRTVPVDGGKGRETVVTAKGSTPSWSPDGSWIAYEFNGDIWKVPVNVLGVVLGKPIRMTSLAAGEGHPTWSLDSQTIVYHAGLSRDYDLWSVPAAGGQPTWLTGAPEFGDYDPSYAKNSNAVAYASFSPEGQAARQWGSTFTQDLPDGTWTPGGHSYYFENTFTYPEPGGGPTDPISFSVNEGEELYDGYVLLRPHVMKAQAWGECRDISAISPYQATRFLYGWVSDYPLTYQEAQAHFNSMAITAYWDEGMSMSLTQRHEIFPRTSEVDFYGYACSFIEPPPMIKVQITDNWFEAQRFLPNTELTYQIYDSPGGNLLLEGVMGSDDSGTAGIWVGDQVDLVPGQYIVISDGYSTKDIVLEPITFDLINTDTGHAEGTAPVPFGRTIWVGIGFPDAGWDRWVPTDGGGHWTAEFEQPIPANFDWIAAWAFDADGDISEVRPAEIFGTWVAIYQADLPAGAWSEGEHSYHLLDENNPGPIVPFTASRNTPLYDGYVLLRTWAVKANTGEGCQNIGTINPAQLTRFHVGYISSFSITYTQAVAEFSNLSARMAVDSGEPVELMQQEIRLYSSDTWPDIVCGATAGPPKMDLRVNYGHEWVESFYEAGHEVVITVTDSEGNEKATATVFTEPKDFWGGETGFQTQSMDWNPAQPDIQPYDWVTAQVDNGAMAKMQIGEISGNIDLNTDTIQGTINIPWFTGEVNVECFPWGSPDPVAMKFDAALSDGGDMYSCSWSGEWDIDYYQDVGVGYFGPDGHWVANAFFARNPHFTVFPEWEFFDGLEWPDGATVAISVEGKPECATTKESWGFFFNGNFGEGCDLVIGDEVTFTYGDIIRTHTVQNLVITEANKEDNTIAGTADPGKVVYVWPHDAWFGPLEATANEFGVWQVDLDDAGYDIQEGASGRSQVYDDAGNATAVDWYVPKPRFTIYPDAQWFDGIDWPDGDVSITVGEKCSFTRQSAGGFFNGSFPEECVVTAGDLVSFTKGITTRTHTVRNLAIKIIDKEANTVTGEADSDELVFVWAWNMDGTTVEDSNTETTVVDGTWFVDYGALEIDLDLGMGIQAEIRDPDGNATSVDLPVPDPRIVASITENWFYLVDFIPGSALDLSIFESQGGAPLWEDSGSWTTDVNGFAWINADVHNVDLEPGSYLVVSDRTTTKDLVVEGFTFDLFDLSTGHVAGTAPGPLDRPVWIGIGFPDGSWNRWAATDADGNWGADFEAPVPANYTWVAAQIFDGDGDATELRPAEVQGQWVAIYKYDLPPGAWTEDGHSYYLGDNHGNVGEPVNFTVSDTEPLYDGFVLLRGLALRANTGEGCQVVTTINPAQPTRFHSGWYSDPSLTYDQAVAQFSSLETWVVWDGGAQVNLGLHEIRLYSEDTWQDVICTYTE